MSNEEQLWDDDAVVVGQTDIDDFNELGILPVSAETEAEIRSWLKPTKYNAENGEFRKHQRSHLAGTGDWIHQSSTYTQWHDSDDQGVLWIKGIPGSGKSVVAASLIEMLSQREKVPTLFFFFRQIIDANHNPAALLRDWLDQVLSYSPPLQARLKKEYIDKRIKIDGVSMNDLWRELKLALGNLPKVFCVVDALDEMDKNNDDFLKALADLGQWRPPNVKVIITSRPVAAVERPLQQLPMLHIRLDERHVDVDIATYVDHCLKNSSIPEDNHDSIKKAVPGRANGLFLYAKLAMDAFRIEGVDVAQVLERLPLDLNVMYTNLLREHGKNSGVPDDLQLLILSWVTHASRPLRLLEMAEMINVTQQTKHAGDFKAIKSLVRAACGPLLEILPDETVCVIHHSLTEFLNGSTRQFRTSSLKEPDGESYPVLHAGLTHSNLARVCIDYLLRSKCLEVVKLDKLDTTKDDDSSDSEYDDVQVDKREIRSEFPFLAYCLDNWHVHMRKAEREIVISEDLLCAVDELLSDKNRSALRVFSDKYRSALPILADPEARERPPLHVAARLGLAQYISRMLKGGDIDVNFTDKIGNTPMLYAATAGHADVVKVLLAHGANANQPSKDDGLKPLHAAAKNNHGEVATILLDAGVSLFTTKVRRDADHDLEDPTTRTDIPLRYAARGGHNDALQAFLPHIKDAETVSRALAWAAKGGHPACVKSMLSHPLVNVDDRVRGDTPLFLAAEKRDIQSMILLLQAGANPSIRSWESYDDDDSDSDTDEEWECREDYGEPDPVTGFTPLHALCDALDDRPIGRRSTAFPPDQVRQLVTLMIESGADINAKTRKGWTAIMGATGSAPDLVIPLLEAGADVAITNNMGESALHGCGDPEMLQMLVEVGKANINQVSAQDGVTPFLLAAHRNPLISVSLIKKLATLGADVRATDHAGCGALHLIFNNMNFESRISEEERLEIVKTLFDVGVPADLQDNIGRTALHCLVQSHYFSRNWRDGKTHDSIVEALINGGVDPNKQDNEGLSVLVHQIRYASGKDTVRIVKSLVEHGVDPRICDNHGRNLLHYCPSQEEELAEYLIEAGCSPDNCDYDGNPLKWTSHHVNNHGRTYLHLAASREGWEISSDSIASLSLSEYANVDCEDKDGIRPLHLVCRKDEDEVMALLKAGASPTKPTKDGTTPIHIAARFRKPNIIGLLLETIEAQDGKEAVAKHLNSSWRTSQIGRPQGPPSALHFACRSGLPESVALLLEAGADPNLVAGSHRTPLLWCTQYEDEQKLWARTRVRVKRSSPFGALQKPFSEPFGIKFSDHSRIFYGEKTHFSNLEEVLDLLVLHGVNMNSVDNDQFSGLRGAILSTRLGHDYTMECLLKLKQRLEANDKKSGIGGGGATTLPSLEQYVESLMHVQQNYITYERLASVYKRSAISRAFLLTRKQTYGRPDVVNLIQDHQWELLRHLARSDPGFFESDKYGLSYLHELIYSGLDSLVGEILTKERVIEMQDSREEFVKEILDKKSQDKSCEPAQLLLLKACEREPPGMPMLRLLVEEFGVNVNDQDIVSSGHGEYRLWKRGDGALHHLARGLRWWHYAQGLKYLIRHGADLELKDEQGRTPLHVALETRRKIQPVQILVEAGADVNAVDACGKSCLGYAGTNLEAIKLLVSHGAKVTTRVLFEAIWDPYKKGKLDFGVFDTLCAVVDPNTRLSKKELESMQMPWRMHEYEVDDDEIYPLYLAASRNPIDTQARYSSVDKRGIKERFLPIIEGLLQHGADPFVTYQKRQNYELNAAHDSTAEVTLLHDILEEGALTEPILLMPNIDIERRDAKGRTLLLAACRSQTGPDAGMDALSPRYQYQRYRGDYDLITKKPSVVKFLVDKGACVTKSDYSGMNALHHILQAKPQGGHDTLKFLLSLAPQLSQQVDDFGASPLHYALQRSISDQHLDTQSIQMLLDVGADPSLPDPTGNTALHHLAMWLADKGPVKDRPDQPFELFQRLVSHGLPINSRNNKGETPLFLFILSQGVRRFNGGRTGLAERQSQAIRLLVDAGSDIFTTNNAGDTLLHAVAATAKYMQKREPGELMIARFKWLLEQGVNPTIENIRHQTCLDVAAANENDPILKLFERKP